MSLHRMGHRQERTIALLADRLLAADLPKASCEPERLLGLMEVYSSSSGALHKPLLGAIARCGRVCVWEAYVRKEFAE